MRKTLLLLTLLALAGCVTLPPMKQIKPDLPAAWPEGNPQATIAADWWTAYNDPALDKLMAEALAHNRDLKSAAARIEEARTNLGLADADRFPEVQIGADAGRSRVSSRGSMPLPATASPTNNHYKLNLQAAWEVDLWGRYREAKAAARADLLATEHARQVIHSSLTGAIAQGYFALAALDAETRLAQDTLANRREAVALHRLRFEGGVASELTLRQAEAEQASVEISLAQFGQQVRRQELALAVLLGREPRAIMQETITRGARLGDLTLPPAVPAGLPSDLLLRRPDLRQAEQKLFSAQARIREAGAAIYPNLSLTANLGTESKALSDLFSGPAGIWGLTAGLSQTLFNAGRTKAAIKAADARQELALIAYEQTLQVAFKEVLDALVTHRQTRETGAAEARRVDALKHAAELADLRYRNGVSNYLEALDARRNLFQAEQGGIEARHAQLAASADLFKALGGGWELAPPLEAPLQPQREAQP
ncbi:MAG: efflux transporter outer membrane subunit [Pseudomonadota bacterium]|nr:efflux transporter outer membrane subunit [Pseudomonadota bacterium]